MIEEVSRLLPDTAWLEALRVDGDTLEISGLAVSASALLPLFERSSVFHDARFAAPVRLASERDRERFNLKARIKRADGAAVAVKADRP